jgi:hypothetical protein
MNQILIFLTISLLLLFLLQKSKRNIFNNIEKFKAEIRNEPILKYRFNLKYANDIFNIYKNTDDYSDKLVTLNQYYNNINIKDENNLGNIKDKDTSLYFTDAYTYNQKYKTYKLLTMCSLPKNLLLVSNKDIDLIEDKLKIGYLNDIDLGLFKKIIKAQKKYTTLDNYEFIKVINVIDELFIQKKIDIFVYFNTIINNELFNEIKNNNFHLIKYDDFDDGILKYYIPYSHKKIKFFTKTKTEKGGKSPSTDNNNIIYNTILIDTLIFTFNYKPKYNIFYLYLLNYFNEFLKINFYMQYFEFLKISKKWALEKQETGKFMNVVETFKIMEMKIDEKNLITLSHDNDVIKYKINKILINGIPIKISDKLFTESGYGSFYKKTFYYVIKVNKNNVLVENANRFDITEKEYNNKDIKGINSYIKLTKNTIDKNNLENGDSVYLDKYKIMGKIIKEGTNKPINKYDPNIASSYIQKLTLVIPNNTTLNNDDYNKKINEFEPLFHCYQDRTILNKGECVDIVDKTGKPKPSYNWDRPCTKDTECDFYLKNKNYLNNRGGCNSGYCEFPVGIKRKSNRFYNTKITENNYPRCYGCEDKEDINCCEKQKNNPKGPDYKYINDEEDRRLSKFY